MSTFLSLLVEIHGQAVIKAVWTIVDQTASGIETQAFDLSVIVSGR
jgi:hypothetical protein